MQSNKKLDDVNESDENDEVPDILDIIRIARNDSFTKKARPMGPRRIKNV